MEKLHGIKKYGIAAVIMGSFAAFIIITSVKNKTDEKINVARSILQASVRAEILQSFSEEELKEINGIRIQISETGKLAYFFEYEADHVKVLRAIASLPIRIDNNRSAMLCTLLNSSSNPLLAKQSLTESELQATAFFWDAKAEDYTFYECYKSPVKHTLLFSKNSDRILHKVEFI